MPGDRGGMGSKDMYDALKQPNKYAGMLYPVSGRTRSGRLPLQTGSKIQQGES